MTRDEVKFGGIEELSAQIAKDCREAKGVSSDPVDAFRKTDAAVRMPQNRETRGAYEPYRICEICAISRKTIDEAAALW